MNTENINNRVNRLFDNDINRVVERANRNGVTPIHWQVVDTHHGWSVSYSQDTLRFERINSSTPGRYLITPHFNKEEADIDGNPKW